MQVDYEVYADGEALLGWLNCTVQIGAEAGLDANALLQRLAGEVQGRLRSQNAEVAHLKMTFSPDNGLGDVAVVNLVRNDFIPELSLRLEDEVRSGQLVVNLRAEADPEILASCVKEALGTITAEFSGSCATLDHLECFRPGKPNPTHRFTESASGERGR